MLYLTELKILFIICNSPNRIGTIKDNWVTASFFREIFMEKLLGFRKNKEKPEDYQLVLTCPWVIYLAINHALDIIEPVIQKNFSYV
jgi:hypothetical protein